MAFPVLDAKATGERIKELRKAHNLTVEKVAEYMGFESVQAVYKWQRGESLPSLDNMYALAVLLETPISDILRGSIEMERDNEPSPFFIVSDILYPSILFFFQSSLAGLRRNSMRHFRLCKGLSYTF
ncbi:MAG: helix-turn-helix transcriptional regulator [Lachnospiraceae bacterium]|nr:helix-turn-helix transcriptional regulator [Lachnospiraceae bacterium]